MQITEHFWQEEFDCSDGTPYPIGWVEERLKPLCQVLEMIREKCGGHPIKITSGYRTPSWNTIVGGKPDSRHMHGDAADFIVSGVEAQHAYEVVSVLQDTGLIRCGGLALYKQRVPFTHIDIRGQRIRWDGSPDQVPL